MSIQIKANYVVERGGVFYYYRPILKDICGSSRKFIKLSLRTSDQTVAHKKAQALNATKEQEWEAIRKAAGLTTETRATNDEAIAFLRVHGLAPGDGSKDLGGITGHELFEANVLEPTYGTYWLEARNAGYDDPMLHPEERSELIDTAVAGLLKPIHKTALDLLHSKEPPSLFLSAARDLWLTPRVLKDKNPEYSHYYELSVREFSKQYGDLPLSLITRPQALSFRDALLADGLSTVTVRKYIGALDRIFRKAIREHQLTLTNPFSDIEIDGEGKDSKKKLTFTDAELETIASLCRSKNTERHLIVALLLNTGARLSEILRLRKEDVVLDHATPHLILTDENRSLKNTQSKRKIPLVGISLWAAQEQQNIDPQSDWFLPVYAEDVKSNAAVVWIKKFLEKTTGRGHTSHCFRHTLADRLKALKVPKDVRESIAGWKSQTMDDYYGTGYPVEVLAEYMRQLKGY